MHSTQMTIGVFVSVFFFIFRFSFFVSTVLFLLYGIFLKKVDSNFLRVHRKIPLPLILVAKLLYNIACHACKFLCVCVFYTCTSQMHSVRVSFVHLYW